MHAKNVVALSIL